jgi:hypothetical protein
VGPARPPGDWAQAFAAAMASIGAGPEHQPGTAPGSAAAPGSAVAADGPAVVIGGHPHDHSTREVGYP